MPSYYFWEKGNVSSINFEAGVTESVNQVAHGFTLPPYGIIPVYDNAGTWTKAIGSASSTYQEATILEITDVDNFVIQRMGYAYKPLHGLAIGRDYYISDEDAGELSYTPTTNEVKSITPVNQDYVYIQNTGYPRVINGLYLDATTGQSKLGGVLIEDTTVSGASAGYDLSLDAVTLNLQASNSATLLGVLNAAVQCLSGPVNVTSVSERLRFLLLPRRLVMCWLFQMPLLGNLNL